MKYHGLESSCKNAGTQNIVLQTTIKHEMNINSPQYTPISTTPDCIIPTIHNATYGAHDSL